MVRLDTLVFRLVTGSMPKAISHGGITSKRSGGPGRINWVVPSEASGAGAAGKRGKPRLDDIR